MMKLRGFSSVKVKAVHSKENDNIQQASIFMQKICLGNQMDYSF